MIDVVWYGPVAVSAANSPWYVAGASVRLRPIWRQQWSLCCLSVPGSCAVLQCPQVPVEGRDSGRTTLVGNTAGKTFLVMVVAFGYFGL